MRIEFNSPGVDGITVQKNGKEANRANQSGISDSTTLSDQARKVPGFISQALSTPEIRSERVNSLRQAVQSGEYSLDPGAIAEAMLPWLG
jgi:negative regulator of flagellin synthesis FlgM